MNATEQVWPSMKHLISLHPFPSSLSLLPFLFLQFPILLQFIFLPFLFFLVLFSPSTYVDPSWLVLVSQIWTSFHVPHASNEGNVYQDWAFLNEAMPISKEDDKSSWEQYYIILLSHIVLYRIWSLLDSNETLLVTWVSPPIFGLQQCCRFRKRMQLNNGGLWLNTLFLYFLFYNLFLYFLFFFFNFYSFFFYFFLQPMLILTACLGVINFNLISCPSCLK